ncbi:hypothetical protein K438DRAFT_1992238 [Mycena galopus ATCC 62051]|nr:hypothetical protein K438DRAFT_1992238 [Mycena galopus ATCC 62051]
MRTTSTDPVASLKPTNIPNDDCDVPRGWVGRRREAHLRCISPSSPCPAPLSTFRRPSLRSVISSSIDDSQHRDVAGVSAGGVLEKLSTVKHRMVVEARTLEAWHEERYGVQGRVVLGRRVVPLTKTALRQHTLQLSSRAFLPEHGSTPARPRAELLARTRTDDVAPCADPHSESHPHRTPTTSSALSPWVAPSLDGATPAPPPAPAPAPALTPAPAPAPAPAHFPPLSLTPCTRTRNHTCFPTPYCCFIRRPILVRFAPHPPTSYSRLGL